MRTPVCVTIVTYNSREFIERCLRSVFDQTHRPIEVVVVDNASTDGSQEVLGRFSDRIRVIYNEQNVGFAGAQNQAIRAGGGEWVLVLNPDVVLHPGFISELLDGAEADGRVGTVCGRLLATNREFQIGREALIDTAGIYFTPALRHLDRGWHQEDDGRYRQTEYVFGASAAAALYRRTMIEDASDKDEFFDPDFFAYREDADVAWRAQLFGWRCLYVPSAVGYHVRSVGPDKRRTVPNVLNMHSVKNRVLMRVKNMTPGLYLRFCLPITARDFLVVAGCLFWEQTSLPAFWHAAQCLPRALRKRRWIMRRRRVGDGAIERWFQSEPVIETFSRPRVAAVGGLASQPQARSLPH